MTESSAADIISRAQSLHGAIASAQAITIDGVHFDFSDLAGNEALAKGAALDGPSIESLVDPEYGWPYFYYPPLALEDIDINYGNIAFWQCMLLPWHRRLSRAEMLEELALIFTIPEFAAQAADVAGLGARPPSEMASVWLNRCDSTLIRVERGDTLRATCRGTVSLTEDPFAFDSDKAYVAVTLEHWRTGQFRSAAVSPLCLRFPASLLAPGTGFVDVIAERVLARSNIREAFSVEEASDGSISWPAKYESFSDWDRAAGAWFRALDDLSSAKNRQFSPANKHLQAMIHESDLKSLFEAGARFGWLAKKAENNDAMRGEALKQLERRTMGSIGGELSAATRRAKASRTVEEFQSLARDLWARHPQWSKSQVAWSIARKTGKPYNTIRQTIKKADDEAS